MKGQLTYNNEARSWSFRPINEMNATTAGTGKPKIQSREGYYRAWNGEYTNSSHSLTEMILWIENSYSFDK
jgi:hypothetical protein